jgi:hypothetical protein
VLGVSQNYYASKIIVYNQGLVAFVTLRSNNYYNRLSKLVRFSTLLSSMERLCRITPDFFVYLTLECIIVSIHMKWTNWSVLPRLSVVRPNEFEGAVLFWAASSRWAGLEIPESSLNCSQEPAKILLWASWIQYKYSHPICLRSNLILPSCLWLGLPSCPFTSGFQIKVLYAFPSVHIYLKVQITEHLTMYVFHSSCNFISLIIIYSPQNFILKYPQYLFFLQMKKSGFTPIKDKVGGG